MFMFCCANTNKDGALDDTPGFTLEARLKTMNRVLLEFISEEQKIGLKEAHCVELVNNVLDAAQKSEIHKNDLIRIYKQACSPGSQAVLKNYFN